MEYNFLGSVECKIFPLEILNLGRILHLKIIEIVTKQDFYYLDF